MSNELVPKSTDPAVLEKVVIEGDLSKLSPAERVSYYRAVCESLGLNPLTKPFNYIMLNGKLALYPLRDATDQLRKNHNVSVTIPARDVVNDVYVVTARATLPSGRTDESTGAVHIGKKTGDDLANAFMKAETKAKRRVTLSIVGLGWLDETEVETIEGAIIPNVTDDGEIVTAPMPQIAPKPKPAEKSNGSTRPMAATALRQFLANTVVPRNAGKSANDKQKGLTAGMLELCFAGDETAEDKRHSVMLYLFGVPSISDLTDAQVLALLDWLKPTKDSGGAYAPDPMAVKEAQGVVSAHLIASGQSTLEV